MLGVVGCVRTLPPTFPVDHPENAGNMIHGNAPFEMFSDAIYAKDAAGVLAHGGRGFRDFVNNTASHLIFTMANTLRDGEQDGTRYERVTKMVQSYTRPVISFGLGLQTHATDPDDVRLHPSAIEMIKTLADQCNVLGVRGEMTAEVIRRTCEVTNIQVTGCPSLLSRPDSLAELSRNLKTSWQVGRPSFSGTDYNRPPGKKALYDALSADHFIIEPVNRELHRFAVAAARDDYIALPRFLTDYRVDGAIFRRREKAEAQLIERFRTNYRLFRSTDSWYDFMSESVSFSYGTRFHCNMASVLSGRPALWITHDARTRELTEFAALPSMSQEEFDDLGWERAAQMIDYEPFFARVHDLFDNFNRYLAANDLPSIRTLKDALVSDEPRQSERREQ